MNTPVHVIPWPQMIGRGIHGSPISHLKGQFRETRDLLRDEEGPEWREFLSHGSDACALYCRLCDAGIDPNEDLDVICQVVELTPTSSTTFRDILTAVHLWATKEQARAKLTANALLIMAAPGSPPRPGELVQVQPTTGNEDLASERVAPDWATFELPPRYEMVVRAFEDGSKHEVDDLPKLLGEPGLSVEAWEKLYLRINLKLASKADKTGWFCQFLREHNFYQLTKKRTVSPKCPPSVPSSVPDAVA